MGAEGKKGGGGGGGGRGVAMGAKASGFDEDLYGGDDRKNFSSSVVEEVEEEDVEVVSHKHAMHPSSRGAGHALGGAADEDDGRDPFEAYRESGGSGLVDTRISNRESAYQARRHNRMLSPERGDAFSDKTPARSYAERMQDSDLDREREELLKKLNESFQKIRDKYI